MIYPQAILLIVLFVSAAAWWWVWQRPLDSFSPGFEPPEGPIPISFPALALALYLVTNSFLGLINRPASLPEFELDSLQKLVLTKVTLFVVLLVSLLIIPDVDRKETGFRFDRVVRQLKLGGLGFLLSLLPVYVLLWASVAIRSEETLHPLIQALQADPDSITILWIAGTVVIAAPLLEELQYRVVLQSALTRVFPAPVAVGLTAVIFSAAHGWPDLLALLPLAVILGTMYHRYRSVLVIVITHALFNAWMLITTFVNAPAG